MGLVDSLVRTADAWISGYPSKDRTERSKLGLCEALLLSSSSEEESSSTLDCFLLRDPALAIQLSRPGPGNLQRARALSQGDPGMLLHLQDCLDPVVSAKISLIKNRARALTPPSACITAQDLSKVQELL